LLERSKKISPKPLPIKIYGEQILRTMSAEVENFDRELVELLKSTLLTMKLANGLGLAANQVGVNKRFFAIDVSHFDVVKEPLVIVNPEIVEISGSYLAEEGCLSFPGLFLEIERAERATIAGLGIDGKELILEGKNLMAKVMLHEIDHLNGKLFVDHLSRLKRNLIKGKLKKIKVGEKV